MQQNTQEQPSIFAVQQQYREGFERCYPGKMLAIRKASSDPLTRKPRVFVEIDGERGDALTIDALLEAAQGFNRGRSFR